jgi:hypothetical protein
MDRIQLGERLCQWHSSSADPIYAVGSFYVGGRKYPQLAVVVDALARVHDELSKQRRMLAGEKVSAPTQNGHTDDLCAFAGYKPADLKANVADLAEIATELKQCIEDDYPPDTLSPARLSRKADPAFLFTLRFRLSTGPVLIVAWEGGRQEPNHTRIDCELRQNGEIVFPRGVTYCGVPAGTVLDGNEAKEAVVSTLAMRPGDTDDDYFDPYTPEQREWAETNGEELGILREDRYCDHETGAVR